MRATVTLRRGSLWRRFGSVWRSTARLFHFAAAHELVEMIFQEVLHVRFLVVDFMPQHLVAQRPRTAVALQRPFARLEQLAQVLIVQQTLAVQIFHLLDLLARKRGEQPLMAVEAFHDLLHPQLECFGVEYHKAGDLWVR